MEYDIFVSYRRVDSQGRVEGRDIARLLTKELKLYGYNVFFDYSEIKDNDFEDAILPAIRNCKIFILLLTANALVRCIDERDWVRREIMEAYNSGRKIISVNPGYEFKGIDGLITNFHLPKSTLVMLVSALAGRENILNAYKIAINNNYRFFSFGDAMFIR